MMQPKSTTWQGFYSTAQVSRLAGIPKSTLYDWKTRGVIAPSVKIIGHEGVADEGYSYADLAIIKLMRGLRDKQLNLRSVARTLRHFYDRFGPPTSPAWQNVHVYIDGKDVHSERPDEWDITVGTRFGQKAMRLFGGLIGEEEATLLVPSSFTEYVEISPDVMEGQPVIRNTRVPTTSIAMLTEEGASLAELVELYAPIPRRFLQKAIDFERSLDRAASSVPA